MKIIKEKACCQSSVMHHAGLGLADLEFAGLWHEQNMYRPYTAQASTQHDVHPGMAEDRQQRGTCSADSAGLP